MPRELHVIFYNKPTNNLTTYSIAFLKIIHWELLIKYNISNRVHWILTYLLLITIATLTFFSEISPIWNYIDKILPNPPTPSPYVLAQNIWTRENCWNCVNVFSILTENN